MTNIHQPTREEFQTVYTKKLPPIEAYKAMRDALQYAVDTYGKPGGPWNVPSDPGGWIERAKAALALADKQKGNNHD